MASLLTLTCVTAFGRSVKVINDVGVSMRDGSTVKDTKIVGTAKRGEVMPVIGERIAFYQIDVRGVSAWINTGGPGDEWVTAANGTLTVTKRGGMSIRDDCWLETSKIIGQVQNGDTFKVTGTFSHWFKVRNEKGIEGWAHIGKFDAPRLKVIE